MSNHRNRQEADRLGLRRKVVSAEIFPDDPSFSIVTLECKHWLRFKGEPLPKRLRCPICREEPWPPVVEERRCEIWVTKWALHDGTIKHYVDASVGPIRTGGHDHSRCAVVRMNSVVHRFFKNEWHESLDAATKHVENLRAKTLAALAEHADRLASLEWVIR